MQRNSRKGETSQTADVTLFSFRKQSVLAFVLVFCCKSASYMSFTFVFLKDLFYLPCKLGRCHFKLFGKVFMYRGFAYPERCGCGSNGGFRVYHMLCELHAPFIFPVIHKTHSNTFWCIKIYAVNFRILLFAAWITVQFPVQLTLGVFKASENLSVTFDGLVPH